MPRHKKTEPSLHHAKDRFETLFTNSPNAVLVSQLSDGLITDANHALATLTGYSREDLLGNTDSVLKLWVNPKDRSTFIRKLKANGSCENFEAQFRRQDGSQFTGTVSAGTTSVHGIPHIISTIRDISERKQIEHNNELLVQRHMALTSSAIDGIHIMDINGNIAEVNETFCRMLGYTHDEALRLNVADWDAQWSREELMERFRTLIKMNGAIFETKHRRRDGTLIDVEVSTTGAQIDGQPYLFATSHDITERKRLDSALRESEARFRTLSEDAPEAIVIHDLESNLFVDATTSAERLFGCGRDEILRHGPQYFYSPNQPPDAPSFESIRERGERIMAGEHMKFERLIRNMKGQDILCEVRLIRLPSEHRKLIRASYLDITERKQAEELLRARDERFQTLFNRASEGIVLLTPDGKVVAANESFARMHGYTPEEMKSINLKDLDTPEGVKMIPERMKHILAGESITFEVDNYHKDGYLFPMEVSASLITVDGEPFIQSFSRDITQRKKQQYDLEAALEFSNNLVTSLQDGFAVLDKNGRTVDANPALCRMTGFACEELIGASAPFPDWPPEQYQRIQASFQKSLKGESGNLEHTFMRKNGERFPVIVSPAVVRDRNGDVISYTATIKDVSQLKRVEAALRVAATAFESQESLMITDANNVILRVNKAFTEDTGYEADEVIGKTPKMLQSGRHDADFYQAMRETINSTGKWQGEIWDRRKSGEVYPKWLTISAVKGEDGNVTHYVGSHIDITERKAAEEKIQHLAFYDHLTDLPNRLLLLDRLKQALVSSARNRREGALLFIDLDNFKNLNDTLGHDIGDQLLQQVTKRLKPCMREGDTVARLGGDEFVVMLVDLSEQPMEAAAQAEGVGEKILAALSVPYHLAAQDYHCTASIGVTLFNGKQQATDELMKQADIAMYQAKKAGRNALRFFDRQMQESISARVSLEGELHHALEFNQLHLYYQVQVDREQRPLGAEALIRWIHPVRGLVSPSQFIPLAEESGLILPIGVWVLDTACAQLEAWQQNPVTHDLVLAINLSARQFHQPDFVAQVQAAIERHAISPMRLKLELTESLLLEDIEATIATMNTLNETGVRFSLDDFGTGYSSLQYLKRLPLDQLKIDQSFVRDITTDSNDVAIVRTIVAMARSMDMSVIAEGVETEEQQQLLLKNGCSNFQGYLFGRPVPIEQFEALLKKS